MSIVFERRAGFPMSLYCSERDVRVRFGGETIAQSSQAIRMEEDGFQPVFYFPKTDVMMDRFTASEHNSR